jgi:hypothetical protein
MSAMVLRIVCAWCTRVVRQGTPGALTSHSCCPVCAAAMEAES